MTQIKYELALQVVEVLRRRDSADSAHWSYALLSGDGQPVGVDEVTDALASGDFDPDRTPILAVCAHEGSGSYDEMFLVVGESKILWLPDTRWDSAIASVGDVLSVYGLFCGTVAELEAHLDEISYP